MFLFFEIIVLTFVLLSLLIMLGELTSKKMHMNMAQISPFECGFVTCEEKRFPFSIYFFNISLIFLIFDVELILIFPYLLTMEMQNLIIMIILIFLLNLLTLGLFYEWMKSMLEWIKFI